MYEEPEKHFFAGWNKFLVRIRNYADIDARQLNTILLSFALLLFLAIVDFSLTDRFILAYEGEFNPLTVYIYSSFANGSLIFLLVKLFTLFVNFFLVMLIFYTAKETGKRMLRNLAFYYIAFLFLYYTLVVIYDVAVIFNIGFIVNIGNYLAKLFFKVAGFG